jgi:hypothetical protein
MPDEASDDELHKLVADARRASAEALRSYRARALELFPHGAMRRDFSGKRIRELTVHHRDHNHDNNLRTAATGAPLLYCHEEEHHDGGCP